jgi:hypothetical protein
MPGEPNDPSVVGVESSLDLQWLAAMAPFATTYFYPSKKPASGFAELDFFAKINSGTSPNVISFSYTYVGVLDDFTIDSIDKEFIKAGCVLRVLLEYSSLM